MPKNLQTRSSAEIIEHHLRPFDAWGMTRYLQARELDKAIDQASLQLSGTLQSIIHPWDAERGIIANDIAERAGYESGKRLAGLLAVREVFNRCPDLPGIRAKLDPLFAELEAALKREAEEARQAALDAQAKREAMERAKSEAVAAVEAQFATA